ncbi:MAG: 3-deoxy-7-phosphoheptulonate synthase [Gemmatimonadetes bacterium]|nr:3-deoxy-7-phosphoheptulonate synthase [Gemmatimonadota bacterium]
MVIVFRPDVSEADLQFVIDRVTEAGLKTHVSRGTSRTIVGCIGDEDRLRELALQSLPGVETVVSIEKPYKLAAREYAAGATVIPLGKARLGDGSFSVIAGPCSVENAEMLLSTAKSVKAAGAIALRGGAFKPRTSPYSFRGLGEEALEILASVREQTGLPVVTEVMDTRQVEVVCKYADVLQIGARNMQNFSLLSEVGQAPKPVLLKRGLAATIEDFLLAAEYVLSCGNRNVILCERGIRTFERATRNTLDIAAIPVLKAETHLPVIVDPSHAAGRRDLVLPLALAAAAVGADGLIVEVHPDPDRARSDGDQSLDFKAFAGLMGDVMALRESAALRKK